MLLLRHNPRKKKHVDFSPALPFVFCLLLIITFLLQIFADTTVFVLYYPYVIKSSSNYATDSASVTLLGSFQ